MIASRGILPLLSILVAGLGVALAACEPPGTAGNPGPSASPSASPAEASPEPTPATGTVQPVITF